MSEWQPIETAPRDGEYILAFQQGSEPNHYVLSWDDGWWMLCDGKDPWIMLRGSEPTHWQPLPEPPTQTPSG